MRSARAVAVLILGFLPIAAAAQALHMTADLPTYSTREAQTPFVVTVLDSNNQPVSSYRGTVTFSSDSSVDVPANYTFTAADAGTHTFNVVFHRGYLHTVNVTDTTNANLTAGDETNVVCPDLTLTASNSGPVCPGGSVTLTATTSAASPTFTWFPAHGGGGLVLHGQTVTTTVVTLWEVVVDDASTGCTTAAETQVDYEPVPSITAPDTASGDFTATLDGDPNGPYKDIVWSITSGNATIAAGQGTSTVTIHPDPAATRVYYAVDATRIATNCRRSVEVSTAISGSPLDATIATSGHVCPGATGSASVPDAGAGAAYMWSLTNATLVSGQGTPNIVFMAPVSGSVQISATVSRNGSATSGNATVAVGGPSAAVASEANGPICVGTSTILDVALSGTPPFTIVWSDGMMQSGIMAYATSRQVAPPETAMYSIASVSDASCGGAGGAAVRVDVVSEPVIERGPQSVAVPGNTAATLTVAADGDPLMFQWYEGDTGDVSHPVGTSTARFVTPPVNHTTKYWVRVMNPCGSAVSAAAVVSVARGRAARH